MNTLTQKQMQIGLEAWAELTFEQLPGIIAGRYNVSLEEVEECKRACTELHKALCVLFGHKHYFEELSLSAHFANKSVLYPLCSECPEDE